MKRFVTASVVVLCTGVAITNAHASDLRILMTGSAIAPTCAPGVVPDDDSTLARDLHMQCPEASPSAHDNVQPQSAGTARVRPVEYYDGAMRAPGNELAVRRPAYTYE
ncbi:hypothetical protein [Lysobacter auxotrophicus]|uniref:Uncharacterized protein n=1 Tax=Lysobacter auxotrophicus TaxID=2992573 RepID=A0ABN6UJ48_9GAMM|nr:hypothetical protein [Lysobacter auxotrophicus]BDU15613.1 hypothetical protein LA521A_08140 [Lysobacter auxotrophicus]